MGAARLTLAQSLVAQFLVARSLFARSLLARSLFARSLLARSLVARSLLALSLLALTAASARADEVRVAIVHGHSAAARVVGDLRRELPPGRELHLALGRLNPSFRLAPRTYLLHSLREPFFAAKPRARLRWEPAAVVYGGHSAAERAPLTLALTSLAGGGARASARWATVGSTRTEARSEPGLLVLNEPSRAPRSALWAAVAIGFPRELEWEGIAARALADEDPRPGYLWLSVFPPRRAETLAVLRSQAREDPRARAPLLRAGAWTGPGEVEPPPAIEDAFWAAELLEAEAPRALLAAERLGPSEVAERPERVARLDQLAGAQPLPTWFRDPSAAPAWPEWERGLGALVLAAYLLPLLLLAGLARWQTRGPARPLKAAYLLLAASALWWLVDLERRAFDLLPDAWGWGFALGAAQHLARLRRAGERTLSRALLAGFALGAAAGLALEHSSAVGADYERLAFLAAAGGLLGLAALWLQAAELWEAHGVPTLALWSRAAGPLGLALGLGALLAARLDPSQLPPAFARALRWGPPLVGLALPLSAALGLSVLWRPLPAQHELAPPLSRRAWASLLGAAALAAGLALAWPQPSVAPRYALEVRALPPQAGLAPLGSG